MKESSLSANNAAQASTLDGTQSAQVAAATRPMARARSSCKPAWYRSRLAWTCALKASTSEAGRERFPDGLPFGRGPR